LILGIAHIVAGVQAALKAAEERHRQQWMQC
jgi:hypothetical protein